MNIGLSKSMNNVLNHMIGRATNTYVNKPYKSNILRQHSSTNYHASFHIFSLMIYEFIRAFLLHEHLTVQSDQLLGHRKSYSLVNTKAEKSSYQINYYLNRFPVMTYH